MALLINLVAVESSSNTGISLGIQFTITKFGFEKLTQTLSNIMVQEIYCLNLLFLKLMFSFQRASPDFQSNITSDEK